jgi:hypothetical protein
MSGTRVTLLVALHFPITTVLKVTFCVSFRMDLGRQLLEWFPYEVTINYNNETSQNFNMVFCVLTCCTHYSINGSIPSKLNKEVMYF